MAYSMERRISVLLSSTGLTRLPAVSPSVLAVAVSCNQSRYLISLPPI
jgi:hypothetical protein